MSRPKSDALPMPVRPGGTANHADDACTFDTARVAEELGMEALGMAKWARAAGLTTLGFLLESAALEAGTQAAALRWPSDTPKR